MDLEYQNAISLKNKNSSITISTVITPFCPHCKVVIKEMLYLLKKHPIEWIIIWNGTISLPDINKEQLGWEELYKTDKQEFIHELYRFANGKQYKVTNIKVSEQTKKEFLSKLRLLKANKIDKFPTILINGKILSKYYTVHDFRYIFNELIEVKKL
jgi:predicted DsbA family dithiol-disulfide isomerase